MLTQTTAQGFAIYTLLMYYNMTMFVVIVQQVEMVKELKHSIVSNKSSINCKALCSSHNDISYSVITSACIYRDGQQETICSSAHHPGSISESNSYIRND